MKLGTLAGFGIGIAALGMGAAFAQNAPTPFIQQTFEQGEEGWQGMGPSAKVSVTHEAKEIKVGSGALKFEYNVDKGGMNLLLFPVGEGSLARAKSVRFWVKTDYTTPLVLALSEKDGGRYVASFTAPGNKWQKVELASSDFTLSDGPNEPKDPDNKLDMDKVENVGILDFSEFFAQSDNAELIKMLNVKTGPHVLLMDQFEVSEEALSGGPVAAGKEIPLDTFAHPQLNWMSIGSELSIGVGKPLSGPGLKADYHQTPGKVTAVVRALQRGVLTATGQLAFAMASVKPTKLVVQLEENGGGKYNTIIEVPGNSELKEFWLPYADFKPADDSKDTNGKLDLDQVKQVFFIDLSGIIDKADQDNTLWINKLRTEKK